MENPYIYPDRIKAALRALELRPTRGMGQNFLTDATVLDIITIAAELAHDDVVVEVGPGLGVLTWELLRRTGKLVAVELDRRLAERLRAEFAQAPRLTVVQGDILKLDPATLVGDQPHPYKLVTNLPYAITTPALRHFMTAQRRPALIVMLVQWEVAQRITAAAGNFSLLTHEIRLYSEPEILARVPARAFIPTPAVDSAVVRLRMRPRPLVEVDDPSALLRLIKAGFLQGRKKLSNALPGGLAAIGSPVGKDQVGAALAAAAVDPSRRAETLSLEEWTAIYKQLTAAER